MDEEIFSALNNLLSNGSTQVSKEQEHNCKFPDKYWLFIAFIIYSFWQRWGNYTTFSNFPLTSQVPFPPWSSQRISIDFDNITFLANYVLGGKLCTTEDNFVFY